MLSLDIWMRENPITYVWFGSYTVALLIFAVEIAMVVHRRKSTLKQIRLLRDAEVESTDEDAT